MNVSFIGSGNLAWHLASALDNTEYSVKEVYSRHEDHAAALVKKMYQASVQSTLDFSSSPSHVFIIAVSDDIIAEIAQEIILPDNAVLLHTSGSQPLKLLEYAAASRIGVFYPLQTFTKGRKVDFSEVPIFVESEEQETERLLLSMGLAISKKVFKISSAERQALHVAAVFASNFTNHMLAISRDILTDHKLHFDSLKPLVAETVNKALSLGPDESQTGPAKRGDLEILDRHLAYLSSDEAVTEIYRMISQHILDRYEQ